MKRSNLLTTLLIITLLASCGHQNNESKRNSESGETIESTQSPEGSIVTAITDYETYLEMRSALLKINPEEFGMTKSESNNQLFGIVLDVSQGDSIMTISAYQTGDVSVYYSTGMLYMAGVNVKKFRDMAIKYTNLSQEYIELAEKTDNINLPESEFVKFYFVTNNGLYLYQDKLNSIRESDSHWNVLIDRGMEIVKAYKEAITN